VQIENKIAAGWSRRSFMAASGATMLGGCVGARWAKPPAYVDGLSFLPGDLAEVQAAGLSAMICDISKVEEVRDARGVPRYARTFAANDIALDQVRARLSASPHAFIASGGTDIGSRPGCATFLQFQSCEPVGDDLTRLARFYLKGLRVLQFTHHNNNLFAGGALERVQTGLTRLGVEGLGEMNRLRLLPDVSHGSEQTMLDAARLSKTPIVLSHGACKAIVNHPRCASDAVIRAIADGGGVIGIFMMSFWLTGAAVPTVDHLVAHIRHAVNVGGAEAVGIANDFPMAGQSNLVRLNNNNRLGVKEYHEWWTAMRDEGIPGFATLPEHVVIPELNNIDRMRRIHEALAAAGFSQGNIERIMGGNWSRVLSDVLG
jgi:membrane dipeptidase